MKDGQYQYQSLSEIFGFSVNIRITFATSPQSLVTSPYTSTYLQNVFQSHCIQLLCIIMHDWQDSRPHTISLPFELDSNRLFSKSL